jgi:hypothetical protein
VRVAIAAAVLLLIAVPLVVIGVNSNGKSSPPPGLRVERSTVPGTSQPQIVVYVQRSKDNVPATAGGKQTVTLVCVDGSGHTLVSGVYPWPFTNTDQGIFEPHIHQNVTLQQRLEVTSCRLDGTKGPLRGRAQDAKT